MKVSVPHFSMLRQLSLALARKCDIRLFKVCACKEACCGHQKEGGESEEGQPRSSKPGSRTDGVEIRALKSGDLFKGLS